VKLSRTCHVSFCQITPLMTCPEGNRSIRVERQITPLKIRGVRGVMEITPFIPPYIKGEIEMESPYSKGDIEGETPCVLEGDVEGDRRKRSSL